MDEDKLREEIKVWLASIADYAMTNKWDGLIAKIDHVADEIVALVEKREREKARKWDRIREIADNPCVLTACPYFARCNDLPCLAEMFVDALAGKEPT